MECFPAFDLLEKQLQQPYCATWSEESDGNRCEVRE